VPHDKLGEAPRAYIVPKSKNLKESSITKFLEPEVAEHKKLAGGVEFIETIPKAASGKILRRVLKDSYSKK
jgi:4-coumarate--CoA ligase